LTDERIEALDERAVVGGLLAPAALLGVGLKRLGVGALGGEDAQEARL
jgi:hypothetical protein